MRVNIIGNNGTFFPKEGENWTLNYQYQFDEKIDSLFIMDGINGLSAVRGGNSTREGVVEKLNEKTYPVITPYLEIGVNNSEAYPLKEIKDKYEFLYFKSTIAFMLAYAAFKGYSEVHF